MSAGDGAPGRENPAKRAVTRYLPGPWTIVASKGKYNDSYWIGPKNRPLMSIAEVRNGAKDKEYGGPITEFANARLIAAAPELYAALRDLFVTTGNASPELLKRAAAALAQAEGRQP